MCDSDTIWCYLFVRLYFYADEMIIKDTSLWSDVKALSIKYVADKTGRSRIENDVQRHFEKMKRLGYYDYTIFQLPPLNFQQGDDR